MTVIVTGCFDLLHPGHLYLLKTAKALGDRLVVGLFEDAVVARMKGPSRPVVKAQDRQAILEAIRYVDEVCLLSDNFYDFMVAHRRCLWVKGEAFTKDEQELAEVMMMPLRVAEPLPGYSTSATVARRIVAQAVEATYEPKDAWWTAAIKEAVQKGYIDPVTHENLFQAKL